VLAVVAASLVVHVGDHVVQEGDVRGLAQRAQQTRSGPVGAQAVVAVACAEPALASVESRRCPDEPPKGRARETDRLHRISARCRPGGRQRLG